MNRNQYAADKKDMNTSYGIIWKILNILDLSLDFEKVPLEELSAKKFKISENRFNNYLLMLQKAGYIEGVVKIDSLDDDFELDISDIKITLEGIEFLIENSTMNKIANSAKNVGFIVAEAGISSLVERLSKIKKRATEKKSQ